MIDMRLFTHRVYRRRRDGDDRDDHAGGFELLMAQELRFVRTIALWPGYLCCR